MRITRKLQFGFRRERGGAGRGAEITDSRRTVCTVLKPGEYDFLLIVGVLSQTTRGDRKLQ